MQINNSPLGKKSGYVDKYSPELLFPIKRAAQRENIDITSSLPFYGFDAWNAYEISWLNEKGKPQVAIAKFIFPCDSENIIESKSFKLYLNSFNNSKFDSIDDVKKILTNDLSKAANSEVKVQINFLQKTNLNIKNNFIGKNIDNIDIECNEYNVNADFLIAENTKVTETLTSDLLKSNCLVTEQPDWGSIQISYTGNKISHEGLLKYIVSFRNHNEFHEHCVERIFIDIMEKCGPEKLTVIAHYVRRGGLDINPYRSTEKDVKFINHRLSRQ